MCNHFKQYLNLAMLGKQGRRPITNPDSLVDRITRQDTILSAISLSRLWWREIKYNKGKEINNLISFPWIITNLTWSMIKLLPLWSAEKDFDHSKAMEQSLYSSPRTVLLWFLVPAKWLEVQENCGFKVSQKMCNPDFSTRVLFINLRVCSASKVITYGLM